VGGAKDEFAPQPQDFSEVEFRSPCLRDVNALDLTTTFLKTKLRLPIIAAPIGD
jgi:isopentenyl diphosphate isomerase/L-lactate dehydrogenase-like FMN-dependent dehydrogenase